MHRSRPVLALVATLASAVAAEAVPSPAASAASAASAATPALRLTDLSLTVSTVAGGSSSDNAGLRQLQIGGHDPQRRGFSLQGAELTIGGAVDPYFTAQATLVASDVHGVELEEAFATSTRLPGGLEAKAGYYLTEFGRANPQHQHAQVWIDRSLPAARLLGGEGMRGTGARLDWIVPVDTLLRIGVGVQNPDDETMTSFLGSGHGHAEHEVGEEDGHHGFAGLEAVSQEPRELQDFLWSGRIVTGGSLGADTEIQAGVSGAMGPQASGEDGRTVLYGVDLTGRITPTGSGAWQMGVEYMGRVTRLDTQTWAEAAGDPPVETGTILEAGGESVRDHGVVADVVWSCTARWSLGLRAERLTGSGDNWHVHELGEGTAEEIERESLDDDPTRADRTRISPLVVFQPSEFTRLRLQYNHDRTSFIPDPVHSVWLGLEVLIGTHPAHGF